MSMTNKTTLPLEDGEGIVEAKDFESHLNELESLMEREIQLAREEEYDEFMALTATMGPMLKKVTRTRAPITNVAFETIARIQKRHRELGLLLTSRSDEMAKRMAQMKTGKSMHRAYKNAADA